MATSRYDASEAQNTIWVWLEQQEGTLERVSLELLGKGRELADTVGWELAALLLCHEPGSLVQEALVYGADSVWLVRHPLLETFSVEAYSEAGFQAILEGKPSVFLCGATPSGWDLAGRLAVRLRTGLTADCTDLRMREGGVLVGEVTGFSGGVLALIEAPQHFPQMATVRPGVFPLGTPNPARSGVVHEVQVCLEEEHVLTRVIERVAGKGTDITQAPVLVIGGRGVQGRFDVLRQLADLLGGEVGATRPPVDNGQVERERQIGQTGMVCRPKVAIVCGASGAFQFVVGIQDAETIIAINSDPEAPIFEYADYGIVGDAQKLIPLLIEELQAIKAPLAGGRL